MAGFRDGMVGWRGSGYGWGLEGMGGLLERAIDYTDSVVGGASVGGQGL